jgi:hypothetical protein
MIAALGTQAICGESGRVFRASPRRGSSAAGKVLGKERLLDVRLGFLAATDKKLADTDQSKLKESLIFLVIIVLLRAYTS